MEEDISPCVPIILKADFVFAWPTAEIAVMGPEGAANIIFRNEIKSSDNPEETRKKLIEEYRRNLPIHMLQQLMVMWMQ